MIAGLVGDVGYCCFVTCFYCLFGSLGGLLEFWFVFCYLVLRIICGLLLLRL